MDHVERKDRPKGNTKRPTVKKKSRGELEREIDDQIEQSFPASDPPSYSQPGNDEMVKR